uniref:Uncharacterized protein n=1 Tax=Anguilla anguilla TaxID=7936 RepID=A0A0E9XKL9_ANGAN
MKNECIFVSCTVTECKCIQLHYCFIILCTTYTFSCKQLHCMSHDIK